MKRTVIREGDHLTIRFPYSKGLVKRVKQIPGKRWVAKEKEWRVPASAWHARMVVQFLGEMNFDIEPVVRKLALEDERIVKAKAGKTGGTYDDRLYPFQSVSIDFIRAAGGRVIIADEMGLGKTVESLVWFDNEPDARTLLVVAPANVTYKWKDECATWLTHKKDTPVHVIEGYKGPILHGSPSINICSYNVMTKRIEELLTMNLDAVIADEMHYLKGRKSKTKRVEAAYKLTYTPQFLLGLSGTPFFNRPIEMHNFLAMLDENSWGNVYQFGNRYCGGQDVRTGRWFQGATNTEELKTRLDTILIRRLKAEVLEDLPDLTRTMLPIDIKNFAEYYRTEKEVFAKIRKLMASKGKMIASIGELAVLRRIVGEGKAVVAVDWAENFLKQSDEKLVIYAHHHNVVDYITERLDKYGTKTITGKVSQKERAKRVKAFQSAARPRILVITSAGGEGIDLFGLGAVTSSTILFVERDWTPAREEQAEARLHRMGQVSPVSAYYLVANGTIDSHMARLVESKRALFRDIIGSTEIETAIASDLVKEIVDG